MGKFADELAETTAKNSSKSSSRSRSRSSDSDRADRRRTSASRSPVRSRSPEPPRKAPDGSRDRSRSPLDPSSKRDWKQRNNDQGNALYVGGLSFETTEQGLGEHFDKYGKLVSVKVVYDHERGRSKGFGFVTFEDPQDAREALAARQNSMLDGRPIRCNPAVPQGRRPPFPQGGRYQERDRDRGFTSPKRRRDFSPPPARRRSGSPAVNRFLQPRSTSRSRSPPPKVARVEPERETDVEPPPTERELTGLQKRISELENRVEKSQASEKAAAMRAHALEASLSNTVKMAAQRRALIKKVTKATNKVQKAQDEMKATEGKLQSIVGNITEELEIEKEHAPGPQEGHPVDQDSEAIGNVQSE
ncbi:hypothetical protein CYMTET_20271, partial [Cymbomonas tetramitiformis]